MPPKTTKTITVQPAKQSSINLFFSKPTTTAKATATQAANQAAPTDSTTLLETQDSRIAAFMSTLSANEKIAHKIAVEKLGTSYDITRTHGFKNWSNRT